MRMPLAAQATLGTVDSMRIVIFGAAGATGWAPVAQADAQGHQIAAFVRTAAKFDLTRADALRAVRAGDALAQEQGPLPPHCEIR